MSPILLRPRPTTESISSFIDHHRLQARRTRRNIAVSESKDEPAIGHVETPRDLCRVLGTRQHRSHGLHVDFQPGHLQPEIEQTLSAANQLWPCLELPAEQS